MAGNAVALDTDIGTDSDDLLALLTVLGSPELELAAVTTVYGDTLLRARVARRALRLAGAPTIPVVPGARRPESGREVWWAGYEGRAFGDLDGEHVDDALVAAETLAALPTVIGIGPLTNIAAALRQPAAGLSRLVLMGGDFASLEAEHNLRSDAVAAAAVFGAGIPITVVGVEQTRRVRMRPQFLDRVEEQGSFGALVASEVRRYEEYSAIRPSVPHDVVAVLLCAAPELFTVVRGSVVVAQGADEGQVRFTPHPSGVHGVVTHFDAPTVLSEVEGRILRGLERSGAWEA